PKAKDAQPAAKAQRRYWAQLASFRTMAQVDTTWAALAARHADLAALARPQVQAVQNEAGVDFYRLMAGDFATKAQAKALCARFVEAKVNCLVTRNDYAATPLAEALAQAAAPAAANRP
ncbi:MAG: SPOR domain-containing protein, partial [Alphaproteobacteria bacterium]